MPDSIRRLSILVGLLTLPGALLAPAASAEKPERTRYIVLFEDTVKSPRALARTQARNRSAPLGHLYSHAVKGYAAKLTKGQARGLRQDSRVKLVSRDHKLSIFEQTTPTGIERIFAEENASLDIDGEDDARANVDVAVIDTGIDEHEDLNVVGRTDCGIYDEEAEAYECQDGVGTPYLFHGTHVAGTIGALDNGKGVVGVAPGARLWSVQVDLSFPVETFESSAMAGVDWVAATRQDEDPENDIEVANMSFGCTEGFVEDCDGLPALEGAISGAVEEGVVMVASAGNNSSDAKATYPASNPDAIAVSALADFDGSPGEGEDPLAFFSNYGDVVDIAAPGEAIYSTEPEDSYGFSSGTSMAAPHVAGAAALLAAEEQPEDAEDVTAIRETLAEAGNFDWFDWSPDEVQEPLLDVSDEALFTMGDQLFAKTLPTAAVGKTTATLKGEVNPHGVDTSYQFEYGTSAEYGSVAPAELEEIGDGEAFVAVEEPLEGLEPGTTYHFRVVAENEEEEAFYGKDLKFTTVALKRPIVWSPEASKTTAYGARLEAGINPNGFETSYLFEYGKSTAYGSKAPTSAKEVGTEQLQVSEIVENLAPKTTYHFRIAATNADGTTYSEDHSLATKAEPEVEWTLLEDEEQVPIEEVQSVEVDGEITVVDLELWASSYSCGVNGEIELWPGDEASLDFELDLEDCEGTGNYWGCQLESYNFSPMPLAMQATTASEIGIEDYMFTDAWDTGCVFEGQLVEVENVTATPDDPEAISSLELSGGMVVHQWGAEYGGKLSGELNFSPAGFYGMGED